MSDNRDLAESDVDLRQEVLAAREALKMSQNSFAVLLGVSKRTLENWEQGRSQPSGAARTLLKVALRSPGAIRIATEDRPGLRPEGKEAVNFEEDSIRVSYSLVELYCEWFSIRNSAPFIDQFYKDAFDSTLPTGDQLADQLVGAPGAMKMGRRSLIGQRILRFGLPKNDTHMQLMAYFVICYSYNAQGMRAHLVDPDTDDRWRLLATANFWLGRLNGWQYGKSASAQSKGGFRRAEKFGPEKAKLKNWLESRLGEFTTISAAAEAYSERSKEFQFETHCKWIAAIRKELSSATGVPKPTT